MRRIQVQWLASGNPGSDWTRPFLLSIDLNKKFVFLLPACERCGKKCPKECIKVCTLTLVSFPESFPPFFDIIRVFKNDFHFLVESAEVCAALPGLKETNSENYENSKILH